MRRRDFIGRGALAAGGASLPALPALAQAPAAPAILQQRYEWRLVTAWPRGLPGVGTGIERIARNIEAMSGGRMRIRLFAAGELVPGLQCFDAVANGTAEMAHDASYYHLQKSQACAFFTAFPFGMTAAELEGWITHGGGQALWDELYAGFGLKPFLAGNTGVQMFGWFRREINNAADLKGLKMRTVGNNARVLTKLGATIVAAPAGEIFSSLQSGALDAAEWVGPYNDLSLGFHQVAPYYYAPGFQELGPGLELIVAKDKYDALPDDLKAIIRVAAQGGNGDIQADYMAHSGAALATLVQKHGVKLRRLSDELLVALGGAANAVLGEIYEGGDALTRRIMESYLAYRQTAMPWTRVGEFTGMQARMLPITLALPR